ncbi:MAG TPA: hypothetical protein PKH50_00190 [bacterium]|nr:hypothetical protein [bacterium]
MAKKIYPYVPIDYKYKVRGELSVVKELYNRALDLGCGVKLIPKAMEDAKQISFELMCFIQRGNVPGDFVVEVGKKALGLDFKYGLWSWNDERDFYRKVEEILKGDPDVVYERAFWEEALFFKPEGRLDRVRIFEAIASNIFVVGSGYKLLELPDGNCFLVEGSVVSQVPEGTLFGEPGGWYIATQDGWRTYSDVLGKDAEEALRWLERNRDRTEWVYYDLYGVDFSFNPVTEHKKGDVLLPPYQGEVLINNNYRGGVYALVDLVDGGGYELIGLKVLVINYNGEGVMFVGTTPEMAEAWERSKISEILAANLQLRE